METETYNAHMARIDDLSQGMRNTLCERMKSADWLCNVGIITFDQCLQAEAAILDELTKE